MKFFIWKNFCPCRKCSKPVMKLSLRNRAALLFTCWFSTYKSFLMSACRLCNPRLFVFDWGTSVTPTFNSSCDISQDRSSSSERNFVENDLSSYIGNHRTSATSESPDLQPKDSGIRPTTAEICWGTWDEKIINKSHLKRLGPFCLNALLARSKCRNIRPNLRRSKRNSTRNTWNST